MSYLLPSAMPAGYKALDLLREYLKAPSRPPSLGEAKTDAPQIWGDGGAKSDSCRKSIEVAAC
jgi:hypothetical protein